jgi:Zn-finger nucleic acid-binding protein
LTEVVVEGITVDACKGGCGGLWFDRFELNKVDEGHEATGEALLDIEHDDRIEVDHSKRRNCPKCPDMVMRRYFFSANRQAEVDECPNCAGMWLDKGELASIRSQFDSAAGREKAAHAYFEELFSEDLKARGAQRTDEVDRARNTARMFRFICPSNYIPGKQEWGAF